MSTNDSKNKEPDVRATRNKGLIEYEANKILDFIESQGLYRKGMYLYDVEKYRPLYSITELAWGLCSNPLIAYQVGELLESNLQDFEDPYKMDPSEIREWVNDFYALLIYTEDKRGKMLCRFMNFYCKFPAIDEMGYDGPLAQNIEKMLKKLDKDGWEPAKYHLRNFNKCVQKLQSI
jgi:hypothetical protein